jgi:hypothetical protein
MRVDRRRLLDWLVLLLWLAGMVFALWFINDLRTARTLRPGGGLILAGIFSAMFIARMIRSGWIRRDAPKDDQHLPEDELK